MYYFWLPSLSGACVGEELMSSNVIWSTITDVPTRKVEEIKGIGLKEE